MALIGRGTVSDVEEALTLASATARIAATLAPTAADLRIGVEMEWLVFHAEDFSRPIEAARTEAIAAGVELPAGGSLTIEPGGQIELATPAFTSPAALGQALAADAAATAAAFAGEGLVLAAFGLDPLRPAQPTLDRPRYRRMETYFRQRSPEGLRLMASTAAFQISVDPGAAPLSVWRRLADVGPVLSAAFANSCAPPLASARQQIWRRTDPGRCAPVPTDSAQHWVDYVLDAVVMLGPEKPSAWTRDRPTFRSWLARGDTGPTVADLDEHLTTLFPPVRPKGHLEMRMIDALPAPGRHAAIAVAWLVATAQEIDAIAAEEGGWPGWVDAVEVGLADDRVRTVAARCLSAAADHVDEDAPSLARACRWWRDHRVLASPAADSAEVLLRAQIEPVDGSPIY